MAVPDAPPDLAHALRRTQRWLALVLGIACALAVGLAGLGAFLLVHPPQPPIVDLQMALQDPKVRESAIAQLVERGSGVWDSHNDPDVGRVLQPGLQQRPGFGSKVSSNSFGLRERQYELPKPPGLVRVVLLGDSFVFGEGVAAEDRTGVFLERFLHERAAPGTYVEVLNLGIGSWNILAECSFVRRQLGLLKPDLVLHFTTSNDLDDMDGVRGFGTKARYSPQKRTLADSRVVMNYPGFTLGVGLSNDLDLGIDYEGRSRYAHARAEMLRLKQAVEAQGGRYLVWNHWGGLHDFVRVELLPGFQDSDVIYISRDFAGNKKYWVAEKDSHWNREGMQRMAKLLYGAIQERGLLPSLELVPWDEAHQVYVEENDAELRYLEAPPRYGSWFTMQPVGRDFEVAKLSDKTAAHVNGGLDPEGLISPYASFTMLNSASGVLAPGTKLGIRGRGLERPEIDGVQVQVYADEFLLDTLTIRAGQPFEASWPVPRELDGHNFFSVRFVASDYVYVGDDLQHCVVFQLERIAVF